MCATNGLSMNSAGFHLCVEPEISQDLLLPKDENVAVKSKATVAGHCSICAVGDSLVLSNVGECVVS